MPSPLGHALGGIAAGYFLRGRTSEPCADRDVEPRRGPGDGPRRRLFPCLAFAAAGLLPDIDFLVGWHSRYTHSVGAALVVVLIVHYAWPAASWRQAVAVGAAYASHVLLDWLGSDATPPIGIMALWPLSTEFYQSNLQWFPAIWRTYRDGFWTHNAGAAVWEALVLGPVAAVAWWWRAGGRACRGNDQA